MTLGAFERSVPLEIPTGITPPSPSPVPTSTGSPSGKGETYSVLGSSRRWATRVTPMSRSPSRRRFPPST